MITLYLAKTSEGRAFAERILRERHKTTAPVKETEHGKPYLEGNPLYFNLSHSGGMIALAVSDHEVGVDLQQRSDVPPAVRRRLSEQENQEDFFRLWTAKEAYVKFLGETLASYYSRLTYANGVLFLDDAPVKISLKHLDFLDFSLCVVTEQAQEIRIVRI